MNKLVNLFLADNQLEAVPFIPDSVRILHLQVCIFKSTASIYTNKLISEPTDQGCVSVLLVSCSGQTSPVKQCLHSSYTQI